MAQRFSGKNILGTLGGMRTSGSTYASPLRSEKKLYMKNPKLRALIVNPSRTYSAAQARAIIGTAQQLTTETGEKQKLIARYKSAGAEVQKMAKAVFEHSTQQQQHIEAPKQVRRYDAGPSDEQKEMKKSAWEQRLEKAQKGRLKVKQLEAEGREVAVERRQEAVKGRNVAYARQEQIQARKEEDRKKELTTLADKNPKKLSGHAIDLAI